MKKAVHRRSPIWSIWKSFAKKDGEMDNSRGWFLFKNTGCCIKQNMLQSYIYLKYLLGVSSTKDFYKSNRNFRILPIFDW